MKSPLIKAFVGPNEINAVVDVREEEQKEGKMGWILETVVCVVMAICPSLCGN